jgi:large subunit ribosomal protein L21e
MLKHKKPRQKGKFSFTKYFQKFKEGDSVAVVRELSFPLPYPKRLQGRTGKILEKRGSAYYVEIADLGKKKRYLIRPIHLKKIQDAGSIVKGGKK